MKRKIVITGASSAIGMAIARKIVKPGDEVILHCFRNETACRQLSEQLKTACWVMSSDFNDSTALYDLCSLSADADILVNCAAITRTGLLVQLREEDLQPMLNANIIGLVRLCRAVLPGMLTKRRGCIVNVSSLAATRGNPGQTVYAGTKGFMESFTRALASEYGAKGVRANCVAPGTIEAGSFKELLAMAPDEIRQSITLKRLGAATDVAGAVAFLCSDDASFITGQTIAVDGGFSRGV